MMDIRSISRLPTVREIELYYFDMYELSNMLGRPDRSYIGRLLKSGKAFGIKHKGQWKVPPDQIPVLRQLVPYAPLKTNNLTESHGSKVRSPVHLRQKQG